MRRATAAGDGCIYLLPWKMFVSRHTLTQTHTHCCDNDPFTHIRKQKFFESIAIRSPQYPPPMQTGVNYLLLTCHLEMEEKSEAQAA